MILEGEKGEKRGFKDFVSVGAVIAIGWSLYQLYLVIFGFQAGYL